MSDRSPWMGWANMDSSLGFNFANLDSSNFFYRLRQDSLSSLPRLFSNPEDSLHSCPLFENDNNTINFHDIQVRKGVMRAGEAEEWPQQESSEWMGRQAFSRRGLRQLAHLLLETLKRKKLYSQKQVVEEIELRLARHAQEEKKSIREKKNIKRRIYDALNVMISAGLLERETSFVKLKDSPSIKQKREYASLSKRRQWQEKITDIGQRIDKKRQLLTRLMSKRKALKLWIQDNMEKVSDGAKRLLFPLVFVIKEVGQPLCMYRERQSMYIKNKELTFLSETDLIENVYEWEHKDDHKISLEEIFMEEVTDMK